MQSILIERKKEKNDVSSLKEFWKNLKFYYRKI